MAAKPKFKAALRMAALAICVAPMLASCGGIVGSAGDFINSKTKFSSSKYGPASKRVTTSKNVPKGGGREMVGKPYKVAGTWYTPKHDPNYDKTGSASWYGPNFHGRYTANGEIFDQNALTAAHPTLPLPSYVRVSNLENGRSMLVRVNDRGPFVHGREIDLSGRAAEMLGYRNKGVARVRVKYVGPAPLEGDDTRMLMASLNNSSPLESQRGAPVQVAFAEPKQMPPQRLAPMPVSPATRATERVVSVSSQGFNVVMGQTSQLYYAPSAPQNVPDGLIDSAFDAAEAMASRPGALAGWQNAVDEDARSLNLQLGVFSTRESVDRVLENFTLIGAVDAEMMEMGGKPVTRLILTQLKPGATRQDVVDRVRELGLTGVVLY